MYSELYDEKHRYIFTSNKEISNFEEKKTFKPTGEYEAGILCEECDNVKIGGFESYASQIIYGKKIPIDIAPVVTKHFNQQGIEFSKVTNIKYVEFKLFLLSILWRGSISTRKFFNEVNLGPHGEKIRKMILEKDPGGISDYPILMTTYVNDRSMPRDLIAQPRTLKYEGHTLVTFFIGGVFYGFLVSSHSKPSNFLTSTITPNNEMLILHIPKGRGWDFISKFVGIKKGQILK